MSQTLLLGWGLAPLRRVAHEIRGIEHGVQTEIEGRYPTEITALTSNLNTLINQERMYMSPISRPKKLALSAR